MLVDEKKFKKVGDAILVDLFEVMRQTGTKTLEKFLQTLEALSLRPAGMEEFVEKANFFDFGGCSCLFLKQSFLDNENNQLKYLVLQDAAHEEAETVLYVTAEDMGDYLQDIHSGPAISRIEVPCIKKI